MVVEVFDDEADLAREIHNSQSSKESVSTTLKTDDRVIARITDGIYRQPGSALRELISNSYDADATRVVIKTDAPRFERILVEDDGLGMTPEVLAHLLLHIGGSIKRMESGKELGVTSASDPSKSPGGRKLIGKIGIGLFSVAQLTHSFQIITKVKNDKFRTIATVTLKQYSDEPQENKESFESGKVNIWREKAADVGSQGTTIVLTNIRPQARNTLRSREIWAAIEEAERTAIAGEQPTISPPKFHIGRVDPASGELLKKTRGRLDTVPWQKSESPTEAFRKLVDAVWNEVDTSDPNPKLESLFDYYLRMVWQLSLAVPLPYVDGHLFDLEAIPSDQVFSISNKSKGSTAAPIDTRNGRPIRSYMNLSDGTEPVGRFNVFIDDLQLLRPIKFRGLPTTGHALKNPLIFLGKCREEFAKIPRALSGGALDFEAYLFWAPKIAPTEHQGSLIRIHGSSGTLFDPSFMRYQVSEQTRLRQITCEIFVHEGLDSALNIDRESFNSAHPHAVYITRWLHSALRQLATAQKKLASEVREQTREEDKGLLISKIRKVPARVWVEETDDPASRPPPVELSNLDRKSAGSSSDAYIFSRSVILGDRKRPTTSKARGREAVVEEKLRAVAQVLASFGVLETLSRRKQERLLRAIFEILDAPEE
jgi:hypothetical protein